MKKLLFFTVAFFYFSQFVTAQTSAKYFEYIDHAKNSFAKKEYKKSAAFYADAFKLNAGKAFMQDRYNAARSWALAENKDSSFVQLFKTVTLYDYTNYNEIIGEKDFLTLHDDKRWIEVTDIVKHNISDIDSKLNSGLVILLDSVYRDFYSSRLTEIRIKNVFGAEEVNDIKKPIKQKDSVNLSIALSIIDKYGWLGKDVVGFIGNYALALVIQHADLSVQDKYMPVVIEAFKNKNMEAYDYALILDKVALRHGQKQLYGTVLVNIGNKNYVAPIEDPENVDKRRSELGLKSMKEYLANAGIKWDITNYKKDLLLLEKEKIEY
jgi:hypothetical protein